MAPPPLTTKPSSRSSIPTPTLRNSSQTAEILSVSFMRSSPAPSTTVSPSAKAPTSARSGSSSTAPGTSPAPTLVPRSSEWRTTRSPTGSPIPFSLTPEASTSAPIPRSISKNPLLVGLSPTPSMRTSEPGTTSAAATQNAAEEMSPGTEITTGTSSLSGGVRSTLLAPPGRSHTPTSTPHASKRRSVWSLLLPGSTTETKESAKRPANSRQLFTCALATGISCLPPPRPPYRAQSARKEALEQQTTLYLRAPARYPVPPPPYPPAVAEHHKR